MAERGGRFGGRGGGGGRTQGGGRGFDRGRGRNNVWHHDSPERTTPGASAGQQLPERDRWEAAARQAPAADRDQRGDMHRGGNPRQQAAVHPARNIPGAQSPISSREDPGPCHNCNISGHLAAHCPTIRCARCGKLGHISHICQTVLPWQCIASMCGFQSPGAGFFYFPDTSSQKQIKEKNCIVVISVLEGNTSARDIEHEFKDFFGAGWRCTARAIGPNKFTMRFPTAKEAERACYWGQHMEMKTKPAVLRLSPWSDSVGAKAQLQKSWVRVRNIPPEKRSESHVAYVGSLVGVTLEIDLATLHRPEYVRILLGCRDVGKIPKIAEGCLGDYFYDFYYDVETVVVGTVPRQQIPVHGDRGSDAPSPKRARTDLSITESSEGQNTTTNQTSNNATYGKSYNPGLETISEHESEEESIEDQGLLIDQIIQERNAAERDGETIDYVQKEKSVNLEMEEDRHVEENTQSVEQNMETNEGQEPKENGDNAEQSVAKAPSSPGKNDAGEKAIVVHYEKIPVWKNFAPLTPAIGTEHMLPEMHPKNMAIVLTPFTQFLNKELWPPLPNVTELEEASSPLASNDVPYTVESPDGSMEDDGEQNKIQYEGIVERFSSRNLTTRGEPIMDRATNVYKRKNAPGLQKEEDKETLADGAKKLMKIATRFAQRTQGASGLFRAIPDGDQTGTSAAT